MIAGPMSPTKHLSQLIDKIISPLVPPQKSYIKDDWDFVKKLPRHIAIPSELVSCDIVSLYTSIPHSLGMKAMGHWVEREKAMLPPKFTKEFIMASILFILNHNNFLFDNVLYHNCTVLEWVMTQLHPTHASQ